MWPLAANGGARMTAWMVAAALIALGLLVYLVFALLRPEDFS